MIKYGVQLYSIKDVASKNLKEALRTVAEQGYSCVEFAGFFNNSADTVKSWLDEYGLTVSSTHTGLAALTPETIADTVAYHKAIGCSYIVIPHASWPTKEQLDRNIEAMNYAYTYLKNEGISLGFHNHSTELLKYPYGATPIDEIIERTKLDLQPDVFFFSHTRRDPVEFCKKYSDRIKLIHLKDGRYPLDEMPDYTDPHRGIATVVCGEGYVPIIDVAKWGIENGKQLIVEVECKSASGPEVTGGSIKYLRSVEEKII